MILLYSNGFLYNIEDKDSIIYNNNENSSNNSNNDDGNDNNIENDNTNNMDNNDNNTFLKQHCKVFQGGYWYDLHRLLNVSYGDKVLYVGDHIYGDILRSKRSLGWRTCLIIPELEHEAYITKQESSLYTEVLKLRRLQYELDDYIDLLRNHIKSG